MDDDASALAAFRADPQRFDAVLTDERMPGLSGSALIRELRGIRLSQWKLGRQRLDQFQCTKRCSLTAPDRHRLRQRVSEMRNGAALLQAVRPF